MKLLLGLIVVLLTSLKAESLTCKECVYIQESSGNQYFQLALERALGVRSNGDCLRNLENVQEGSCNVRDLPAGYHTAKCATIAGKIQVSIDFFGDAILIGMNLVARHCRYMNPWTQSTENRRYDMVDYHDEMREFLRLDKTSNITYLNGDVTICNTNNCNSD